MKSKETIWPCSAKQQDRILRPVMRMELAEQHAAGESSAGRRPPKPRRAFENSRQRVRCVVQERLRGPRQKAAFTAREASERDALQY